jgi:hypothetical protein
VWQKSSKPLKNQALRNKKHFFDLLLSKHDLSIEDCGSSKELIKNAPQ